jgi:hypothetical protein
MIIHLYLTQYRRVLPEKLTRNQLVKNFPTFYGTGKVHCPNQKSSSPVHIMSQINTVHAPVPRLTNPRQYYSPTYAYVFLVASFPQVSLPQP